MQIYKANKNRQSLGADVDVDWTVWWQYKYTSSKYTCCMCGSLPVWPSIYPCKWCAYTLKSIRLSLCLLPIGPFRSLWWAHTQFHRRVQHLAITINHCLHLTQPTVWQDVDGRPKCS